MHGIKTVDVSMFILVAYLKSWEMFRLREHISRDIDVCYDKNCHKVYICEILALQLWTESFRYIYP